MKYLFLKNWHKLVNKKKYKQLKLKENTEKINKGREKKK